MNISKVVTQQASPKGGRLCISIRVHTIVNKNIDGSFSMVSAVHVSYNLCRLEILKTFKKKNYIL